MTLLRVTGLGKAYRTYQSEFSRMASWFFPYIRPINEHWALRNINFDVPEGSAIGLVGRNGAGKSTLLKLITGTLAPTTGQVEINGTIGSILELGLGFNPMLTGLQNASHSLSMMGLPASSLPEMLGQVEAFAELGEYFEQPVRIYSSGMQVRLAFAVVTARRPQLLIVDEALSVGDAYFQHKSFDRIRAFREQGTSLLIVSHDRSAILGLCDRAIVLDAGRVVKDGDPIEAMDYYNALIGDQGESTIRTERSKSGDTITTSGTGEATVERITLIDQHDKELEYIEVGQKVVLEISVSIQRPIPRLVLGYMLRDRLGQAIYGTNTHHLESIAEEAAAGDKYCYRFEFTANLGPGSYSISTALTSTEDHHRNNYEWRDLACVFEVVNRTHSLFAGCNWMPPALEIQRNGKALSSRKSEAATGNITQLT